MVQKEELLYYIKNPEDAPWNAYPGVNRMGCSEKWYNPLYAMTQTFTAQEIQDMADETVEACLKVADAVGEGLY